MINVHTSLHLLEVGTMTAAWHIAEFLLPYVHLPRATVGHNFCSQMITFPVKLSNSVLDCQEKRGIHCIICSIYSPYLNPIKMHEMLSATSFCSSMSSDKQAAPHPCCERRVGLVTSKRHKSMPGCVESCIALDSGHILY